MAQAKMTEESHVVSPRSRTLHHCSHPNPAERVFAIPKLFENIFAPLLMESMEEIAFEGQCPRALQILRNRSASKVFKSNIDNSTLLQDLMYFNTPNGSSRLLHHNPCRRTKPDVHEEPRPWIVKRGFNEILNQWDTKMYFFKTPANHNATEDDPLWVFEEMGFWYVCENMSSPMYRTEIGVKFSKYRKDHQYDWELPKQKIMAPSPYLNMRFSDPCCKVMLIAEIKEGGSRRNNAARCIRGDLHDGATFGEVLVWLDLWEMRQHGQSNLVANVRSNGYTPM